jgi:hypothetical protein
MSTKTIKRDPQLDFADLPYAEKRQILITAIRREIANLQALKELKLLAPDKIASILTALLVLVEWDGARNEPSQEQESQALEESAQRD